MGNRYYITEVQLGLLIELSKEDREKMVFQIIDKQFLGVNNEEAEE